MRFRLAGLALAAWLLIACGSSPSGAHAAQVPSPSSAFHHLPSLGQPGCNPAAAFGGWPTANGLPEAGLDSAEGSLWALFFAAVPPPAGTEVKVVWRMTGSGGFRFAVIDAQRKIVPLAWGPEKHQGSNWNHPGDEVGTGIDFPHRGCWDIHVARDDVAGDLWLEVA